MNYGYYQRGLYLEHHGIKGQRWGVKHGPPYPLYRQEKYKYRGRDDSGEDGQDAERTKRSSKTPLVKFLGRAALHLYSGNIVGVADDVVRLGKSAVGSVTSKKYEKERTQAEVDEATGFKKKSKEMTPEEDLKRVNPDRNDFDSNTKNNCMLCTTTYELRRRGFDVAAAKDIEGYHTSDIKKWFPEAKITTVPEDSTSNAKTVLTYMSNKNSDYAKKVVSMVEEQPEGARGNIMGDWRGVNSAHSMFYEVKDGKMIIRDGQINKTFKNPEKILAGMHNVRFARLDNVDFDKDQIKRCCL